MASLPPIFKGLAALLLLTTCCIVVHAATDVAPGPSPAPLNLTAILEKGGQFTTMMRLLKETQVGVQIQSQLNNSFEGLTIFAPTDNAFANLKPGTLNSLTNQDQVNLVLFHVLPRYYSAATFQTASNPVRTQASDKDGPYTLNITSTANQVNVSTGVDETQVDSPLYSDFPLAVYPVDKVLLPYSLFGAKPPSSAPSPSAAPKTPAKKPSGSSAGGPAAASDSTPSAASFTDRGVAWGYVVGIGLMLVGRLFCGIA